MTDAPAPRALSPFGWWSRIVRFALLRRPPAEPADVPIWGFCVPFVLWRTVVRHDGTTFQDHYAPGMGALGRRIARWLYFGFLMLWPLLGAFRALSRGREAGRYYRHALARPDLVIDHPKSDYTELEAAWGRPDQAIGMAYASRYARDPAEFFLLDDKEFFVAACRRASIPLPPTVTADEAIARGGEWIVKDPDEDLGYGVRLLTSQQLAAVEERESLIVQERLRNHPSLFAAYPDTAPLSSFRVITLRDPATGELSVARCAVRIGRAGMVVDNTQQGGIWASVDLATGELRDGVTKATFGLRTKDVPVRERVHPDTGRTFVGLRVPWFDEGRAMALDAHRRLAPDALTLGWDVALAATGPVLLEVNVWTTSYDYDPRSDAFGPVARAIVQQENAAR